MFGLILFAACAVGQVREDTARLAERLKRFRAYRMYQLQPVEYKSVQDEFSAWIDSLLKSGKSLDEMNRELDGAGLLSDGAQDVDTFETNYAGFLGEVTVKEDV
jgi:hypothetical protein